MNERIRELAEQAGFENGHQDRNGNSLSDELEKFAELILEDMHRKVIASILIIDVVMNEKGQTPTSKDYILAIHKDFGVEE